MEGLDSVIWSEQYAIDELVEGDVTIDVEPERSWVGESLVALRYGSPAQGRFLILIDAETGTVLAMTNWEDLVGAEPIDLVRNRHGELVVLALDADEEEVREYEIALVPGGEEQDDGVGDEDEENGQSSDAGEESGDDEEGSRCQQSTGGPAGLFAAGLFLLWWYRRFDLVDCVNQRGRLK